VAAQVGDCLEVVVEQIRVYVEGAVNDGETKARRMRAARPSLPNYSTPQMVPAGKSVKHWLRTQVATGAGVPPPDRAISAS
jgi:hypothetical protein